MRPSPAGNEKKTFMPTESELIEFNRGGNSGQKTGAEPFTPRSAQKKSPAVRVFCLANPSLRQVPAGSDLPAPALGHQTAA